MGSERVPFEKREATPFSLPSICVHFACSLFVGHLLRELLVVLLEALAYTLLGGHPLEYAAVDAAVFLG